MYPTALELAEKARETTGRDPTLEGVRLRALELLGDLHSLMGDLEAANQEYDAANRMAIDAEASHRIENKRHRPGRALRDGAQHRLLPARQR